MKILKPGKVEMRKFVCPVCGCEFTAVWSDCDCGLVECPQEGCCQDVEFGCGEPYEEPHEEPTRDKETDKKRLSKLLERGMYAYSSYDKFAEFLIANGVTSRSE